MKIVRSVFRFSSRRCVAALSFFLLWESALAGPATDRLQHFFKSVQSLRADFQQTVLDANGKQTQQAQGTFVMQRPSKFRWDYTQPHEQLIVADGTRLWVYDKDLEQVTVKKLDAALGSTPALLLAGSEPLEKNFAVNEIAEARDGLRWAELVARADDTGFERVRLGFGEQSLEAMELIDSFGQTTRLRFMKVRLNPGTSPSEFKFDPPKGVDVVGED